MSDPMTVIIKFSGDPEQLLPRYKQLTSEWATGDAEQPLYAFTAPSPEGLVAVNVWTDSGHAAFGQDIRHRLERHGLPMPAEIEHLPTTTIGWNWPGD